MTEKISGRRIKKILNDNLSQKEGQNIRVCMERNAICNGMAVYSPSPEIGPLSVFYYKKEVISGRKKRVPVSLDYDEIKEILSTAYPGLTVENIIDCDFGYGFKLELKEKEATLAL